MLQVMSYHVISSRIIPCYVISCIAMSCHAYVMLSNQIKSNQIKSNQIKSNRIKSSQIISNQSYNLILFICVDILIDNNAWLYLAKWGGGTYLSVRSPAASLENCTGKSPGGSEGALDSILDLNPRYLSWIYTCIKTYIQTHEDKDWQREGIRWRSLMKTKITAANTLKQISRPTMLMTMDGWIDGWIGQRQRKDG